MIEEDILLELAAGNEEHLDELIKKYDKIINYKISKYKSYILDLGLDKNDLYQEGLLGLITGIKTYKNEKEANFNTYVDILIDRKISDAIKSYNRNKHKILNESLSLDYNEDNDINLYNKIKTNTSIPGEYIEAYELNCSIKEKLTEEENKVYELKKENKTNKEISIILDKPIKSIENTLYRIRTKIKSVD